MIDSGLQGRTLSARSAGTHRMIVRAHIVRPYMVSYILMIAIKLVYRIGAEKSNFVFKEKDSRHFWTGVFFSLYQRLKPRRTST